MGCTILGMLSISLLLSPWMSDDQRERFQHGIMQEMVGAGTLWFLAAIAIAMLKKEKS